MKIVKTLLYSLGVTFFVLGLYFIIWCFVNGEDTEFVIQGMLFITIGIVLFIIGWAIVILPPDSTSAKPLKTAKVQTDDEEIFVNGVNVKNLPFKSKTIAILLCLFLGLLGIHQIYIGNYLKGLTMLGATLLFGWTVIAPIIVALVCLIDLINIISGQIRDEYNRQLM